MGQAMAYSSFRKVNGGEKSTVAFVGKIPYTKYDNQIQLSLPGEPVNEQASIVKAYVVIPSQYGERGDDSSHQIRQVSSTILDVTKGYPVHGFYRLKVRDAQRARDDRFLKILDNTQSFGKSHPKDEYVEMDIPQSGSSSKQGKQGGKGSGQSSKFKHKTTSDGGLGQVFSALALATVSFYLML
ncbi:hypothetical protein HDE_03506 [Halotydeus destructor]|nr:hypothetical protein HDE_03506 [Halotydeus destructor]